MNKSLKIFIAYAYKDTKAKDQLMICLHRIKSEGLISIWHDNEILAGDNGVMLSPATLPIRIYSSTSFLRTVLPLKIAIGNCP